MTHFSFIEISHCNILCDALKHKGINTMYQCQIILINGSNKKIADFKSVNQAENDIKIFNIKNI